MLIKCFSLLICFLALIGHPVEREKNTSLPTDGASGFAVCELFTSEGCSSCPPAESLLNQLNRTYADAPVYFLEFHVDYWDRNGWKDRFSNHEFTERQYFYDKVFVSEVYTPQMIINGSNEFVGSESNKITGCINSVIKSPKTYKSIECSMLVENETITVNYSTDPSLKGNLINAALLQKHDSSIVTAGENKNRTLDHVNIVRAFATETISRDKGSLKIAIPPDLLHQPLFAVIYTQNKKKLDVTSVSAITTNN